MMGVVINASEGNGDMKSAELTMQHEPRRTGLWRTLVDTLWREDEHGIIGDLEEAWSCKLALLIAAIWAGSVPLGVYVLTHVEGIHLTEVPYESWTPRHFVALGGLLFSASSVWVWGKTFYNGLKSACWVSLMEGCMVFSKTEWLQILMLTLIVVTNMMAAGSRAGQKEKKRRAAQVLRAAAIAEKLLPAAAETSARVTSTGPGEPSATRTRAKTKPSAGELQPPVAAVRIAQSRAVQSSPA